MQILLSIEMMESMDAWFLSYAHKCILKWDLCTLYLKPFWESEGKIKLELEVSAPLCFLIWLFTFYSTSINWAKLKSSFIFIFWSFLGSMDIHLTQEISGFLLEQEDFYSSKVILIYARKENLTVDFKLKVL